MKVLSFETQELQADGSFLRTSYQFVGSELEGWSILRNGQAHLNLGPGYVLLKGLCCGICSTDLARCFLPFPLPQITGHEVVALQNDQTVVIEINASHKARGIKAANCPFCSGGMESHCPERLTLGINRLPGGFSPYFLAPIQAIRAVPDHLSIAAASFTEPFAAALQAIEATPPREGDTVAVLGPRRLGLLLLAALSCVRKETGRNFKIAAMVRHSKLAKKCLLFGADEVLDLTKIEEAELRARFDIVYDTTGTPDGFELALHCSRRVVHLKSTHGQPVMGISSLTAMVVDELALLPFKKEHLGFCWPAEKQGRANRHILVSQKVSKSLLSEIKKLQPESILYIKELKTDGEDILRLMSTLEGAPFPHFDLAIVSALEEVNSVLQPVSGKMPSALRPRGAILLAGAASEKQTANRLSHAIRDRQLEIQGSRCGSFDRALKLLQENPHLTETFEKELITHRYPLEKLEEAFQVAADSKQSIKVLVQTALRVCC